MNDQMEIETPPSARLHRDVLFSILECLSDPADVLSFLQVSKQFASVMKSSAFVTAQLKRRFSISFVGWLFQALPGAYFFKVTEATPDAKERCGKESLYVMPKMAAVASSLNPIFENRSNTRYGFSKDDYIPVKREQAPLFFDLIGKNPYLVKTDELTWINGQKHGVEKSWAIEKPATSEDPPKTHLTATRSWKQGKRDGEEVRLRANGTKFLSIQLKDGKKEGEETEWNAEGKKVKTKIWKSGNLVSTTVHEV